MGSYLSRARPGPESAAVRVPEQLERPPSLALPRSARLVSSAWPEGRNLTRRRLSREHPVASPGRRRRRRRLVTVHRQRSPGRKARCLFLGFFSSVSSSGHRKKPGMSVSSSGTPRPAVILHLASAEGKLTLCVALGLSASTQWPSGASPFLIPNVTQSRLRALKESSPESAKEEKDLASLGDSGEGFTRQEGSNAIPERQEDQRRRSDGSESNQSAFRRLVVNGVLSSFLPRPGPLKRDFCCGSSVNSLTTKSQSCFLSSRSKRNAITSSYSSTRGLPLLPEKNGAGPAGRPCPGSSHFLVPAKKASEEGCQASSSASPAPQKKSQPGKVTDGQSSQQQNLRGCSNPTNLSRPPKRKIVLLSCRRKDPVILPAPPQVGYRVTAEDIDLEKRAATQWINKVLKGETQDV